MAQTSSTESSEPNSGQSSPHAIHRRYAGLILRRGDLHGAASKQASNANNIDSTAKLIPQLLPVGLLIAILGAAGIGALLIRWRSGDSTVSAMFASTEQFDEWSAIVAVVLGVSVAIAIWAWSPFRRVSKEVGSVPVVSAVVLYVLIGATVVFGPFAVEGGDASFGLSYFYLRVGVLSALLLAAGTGSFGGLTLLWYSQRASVADLRNVAGDTIQSLLLARQELERFFVSAAILITGGIVIIGGLRGALNAEHSFYRVPVVDISVGSLILYGCFFTMLLGFVLLPAYSAWKARAASLRDRLYPIPDDGYPPRDWYQGRSDLEDLLAMHLGTTGRFLTLIGILAPLIGSIISVVIPALHS
jgi:hypothetical protein